MTSVELSKYVFPPLADIINEYKHEVLVHLNIPTYRYFIRRSPDEAERFIITGRAEEWVVLPYDLAKHYEESYHVDLTPDGFWRSVSIAARLDEFLRDHPSGDYNISLSPEGLTALQILEQLDAM